MSSSNNPANSCASCSSCDLYEEHEDVRDEYETQLINGVQLMGVTFMSLLINDIHYKNPKITNICGIVYAGLLGFMSYTVYKGRSQYIASQNINDRRRKS